MPTTVLKKKKVWTYNDYLTLPDDHNIYEVIDGQLYMTPAPTTRHQRITRNLFRIIDQYVLQQHSGEVLFSPIDVVFDPSNVVQPDIIFISKDNLSIITEKNIQGTPNLIIEILSDGIIQKDRIVKMKTYAKYGIKHLWLDEFKPSLFPDFTIPLKEICG